MTEPTRAQLLHLAARARDERALPAEHDALAAGITAMADEISYLQQLSTEQGQALGRACTAREEQRTRAEKAEAAIEQAELDAEQQARHFRTICGERESYRQAWKYEQKRRAVAEAAIEHVRALADRWEHDLPEHVRIPAVAALRAALDQAQQPTT